MFEVNKCLPNKAWFWLLKVASFIGLLNRTQDAYTYICTYTQYICVYRCHCNPGLNKTLLLFSNSREKAKTMFPSSLELCFWQKFSLGTLSSDFWKRRCIPHPWGLYTVPVTPWISWMLQEQIRKGIKDCLVQRTFRWKNTPRLCGQFPFGGTQHRVSEICNNYDNSLFNQRWICPFAFLSVSSADPSFRCKFFSFFFLSFFLFYLLEIKSKSNKLHGGLGFTPILFTLRRGDLISKEFLGLVFFPPSLVKYIPNSRFWVFLWKEITTTLTEASCYWIVSYFHFRHITDMNFVINVALPWLLEWNKHELDDSGDQSLYSCRYLIGARNS